LPRRLLPPPYALRPAPSTRCLAPVATVASSAMPLPRCASSAMPCSYTIDSIGSQFQPTLSNFADLRLDYLGVLPEFSWTPVSLPMKCVGARWFFSIDSVLTVSRLACENSFKAPTIEIVGSYAGWLQKNYEFDHFEVSGLAKKNF
jgi:hypothetical protein